MNKHERDWTPVGPPAANAEYTDMAFSLGIPPPGRNVHVFLIVDSIDIDLGPVKGRGHTEDGVGMPHKFILMTAEAVKGGMDLQAEIDEHPDRTIGEIVAQHNMRAHAAGN